MKQFKIILLASMVVMFTACGGGSSADTIVDDVSVNILPTVDAGPDLNIELGQSVTITGTGTDSDGTIVSYEWTYGTDVLATTASFEYTPTTIGGGAFTLTVMDDDGATASDSMNLTVTESTGGGSSTTTPTIIPNGIWTGTQVVNGAAFDIVYLIYNNEIVGMGDTLLGLHYLAGSNTMEQDQITAEYRIYDSSDGMVAGEGNTIGTVIEQTSLEGSVSYSTGDVGTISLSFDNQYNNPSSLTYIAGNYITYTISPTGEISGIIGDCSVTGTVYNPDPSVNLYDITYTLDNCSQSGIYSGLGVIYDNGGGVYGFNTIMYNTISAHTASVLVPKPSTF